MKYIDKIKILAFMVLSLGLSSCDAILDDEITDFGDTPVLVQFGSATTTANFIQTDEAPVYTYDIPVTLIGGRNQPINQPVDVTVSIDPGSTATEGVEYNLLDNTVTIPSGEMSANIQIEVMSENLDPFDPKTLILDIESSSLTVSESSATSIVLQAACEYDITPFIGTYAAVQGTNSYEVKVTAGPEENTLTLSNLGNTGGETVIELNDDPTNPTIIYRSADFDAALSVHSTYGNVWATTVSPESSSYGSCDNSMSLEFRRCVSAGCFAGTLVIELTKK